MPRRPSSRPIPPRTLGGCPITMRGMALGPRGGDQIIPRPPDVVVGAPPPWSSLVSLPDLSWNSVAERVRSFPPGAPPEFAVSNSADAAVLVALMPSLSGTTEVVFTKRPQTMKQHSGEISFPGGKVERGESCRDAALREAHEEVDLMPQSVQLAGRLDALSTVATAFTIYPFVGLVKESVTLTPHPAEVASILRVGVDELLQEGVYHQEVWQVAGHEWPMHFYLLEGETVWGATAAILTNFLGLLTGTRPPAGRPPITDRWMID